MSTVKHWRGLCVRETQYSLPWSRANRSQRSCRTLAVGACCCRSSFLGSVRHGPLRLFPTSEHWGVTRWCLSQEDRLLWFVSSRFRSYFHLTVTRFVSTSRKAAVSIFFLLIDLDSFFPSGHRTYYPDRKVYPSYTPKTRLH